jgi:ATP-dependent exoDNAse (exonuclease V) beta subunit
VTPSDQEARDRIVTALDETLIVEAAAGTGKTSEIVRRIIAVLASGRATADSIVAVTFTVKAAGELKLRLRSELEADREGCPAGERRRKIEDALRRLEQARINTIHGFCADLLRERPVEAGVDPAFATMDESQASRLFRETFQSWIQRRLEDPPEGLRRILRRADLGGGAIDTLQRSAFHLNEWRDYTAPWRREAFPREAAIDDLVQQLQRFATITDRCPDAWDPLYRDTRAARELSREIEQAERVANRDYDGIEATLIALPSTDWFRNAGPGEDAEYAPGLPREEVLQEHQRLLIAIDTFRRQADRDIAPLLQLELREMLDLYDARKRASGKIDFLDQLLRTRDLLRDCRDVREMFQRRFTHLFIDEFQDTDVLQSEILLLLSADDPTVSSWREVSPVPGKLFIVGDPKQSVYRFRRADVRVYHQVRDLLQSRGASLVHLQASFRSVPAIQQAVNRAFRIHMTGETDFQSGYVSLQPFREDVASQPAVVALPVPEPYGKKGGVTKKAVKESLPAAVAAFVRWLLHDSGWTVTERERPGERVALSARHICILFKNFTAFEGDVTRPYVEALDAREIPHLLVGGKSLHNREEVMALRAALTAIEYPDDELAVFATLHGPLFAIGDADLFEYRTRYGYLNMFRSPQDLPSALAPIREALELLCSLHRSRNTRPAAETVERLLEGTRALAGFVFRPGGEQALANVLLLADLAREFDATGGLSFRDFVEQLEDDAERGQATEAPTTEEGSDGVRLMTVHKAKGLEFPVVILADPTAPLTPGTVGPFTDASRGLCAMNLAGCVPLELQENEDREREETTAENIRVAYVAATRARDLLVIPVTGGGGHVDNSWLAPLDASLYPETARWNQAQPSPGCPPFTSTTTVMKKPGLPTERPGLHLIGEDLSVDACSVTWWDPEALRLNAEEQFGLRQQELLKEPEPPILATQDRERYESWRTHRDTLVARSSVATLRIRRATDAASDIGHDIPVSVVELGTEPSPRPGGPRFGSLVHAILAATDLDAGPASLQESAQLQGRIIGADDDEIDAARKLAEAALAHPLLRRAAAASHRSSCRRETPVTLKTPEGVLVEGVVDLAFEEEAGWVVIDFKTDQDLAKGLEVYRDQVRLYAQAVADATGRPAQAVLLKL